MLIVGQPESVVAVREEKSLLYLDAGGEEGDRTITPSLTRRFPRFEDGKDHSFFPDRRDIGPTNREIK